MKTRPATVEDLTLGVRLRWKDDADAPRHAQIPQYPGWCMEPGHPTRYTVCIWEGDGWGWWDLDWFVVEMHEDIHRARPGRSTRVPRTPKVPHE